MRHSALQVVGSHGQDAQSTVHLGERLRYLRLRQGLTQEQAAATAGITRNALLALERHRFPNPYLSTLLALMRCYGLSSLDELLGRAPAEAVYDAWEAAGWVNTRRAVNDS
ncbi:MAG TPA: helix-turn-helix transcriptional regulator [Pseudonocardiaceae bacterium]|nr:helix-turn-helix transcriptional regulator [Pseudonocardiaceae bacterium]